jgi:hypothetical protein
MVLLTLTPTDSGTFGQTSRPISERLEHHLIAARQNIQRPVYDWIRRLAPALPYIAVLEEIESVVSENKVVVAETKWMKRLRHSDLFNVSHNQQAYDHFVNPWDEGS